MKRSTVLTALVSAAAMLVGVSRATPPKAVPASPSRSFEFTSVIHVPALPAGSKQLRMWIPLPYEGAAGHQSISQLKIDSPVKYRVSREGHTATAAPISTSRQRRRRRPSIFEFRFMPRGTRIA